MCPQWDGVPMITDPCHCDRSQQETSTTDERQTYVRQHP